MNTREFEVLITYAELLIYCEEFDENTMDHEEITQEASGAMNLEKKSCKWSKRYQPHSKTTIL